MSILETGDFRERIRQSFDRQGAMAMLDAELTRVEQAMIEIELPYSEKLTQQHGFLHAGVISAALDTACTYAAYTTIAPDASILTIEFKVNLLAPAIGERVIARGRVVRAGRTISVCTADAFAIRDGAERHVATMTATLMTVAGRETAGG